LKLAYEPFGVTHHPSPDFGKLLPNENMSCTSEKLRNIPAERTRNDSVFRLFLMKLPHPSRMG